MERISHDAGWQGTSNQPQAAPHNQVPRWHLAAPRWRAGPPSHVQVRSGAKMRCSACMYRYPCPSKEDRNGLHITPLIPLVAGPSVSEIVWTPGTCTVQYGARDVEQVIGLLVMDGVSPRTSSHSQHHPMASHTFRRQITASRSLAAPPRCCHRPCDTCSSVTGLIS
ncbi:hypothetical protein V8C34DRAFT_271845 [Trichoderma compactum]